jgi:hypothetical protein
VETEIQIIHKAKNAMREKKTTGMENVSPHVKQQTVVMGT